jgi:hypothetical protein
MQFIIDCICPFVHKYGNTVDQGQELSPMNGSEKYAYASIGIPVWIFVAVGNTTCIFSVVVISKCPSRVAIYYLIMKQ